MFFSGQLLAVLYHKLIDVILIRLLSIDLGQTNNHVDYRLHRYCLKALKVTFDNAVRLTLLPSRNKISSPSSKDEMSSRSSKDEISSRSSKDEISSRSSKDEMSSRFFKDEMSSRSSKDEMPSHSSKDEIS
ncbi:hypothetical protein AVEN_58397-1 [Araneus ventricosus]|uniref:Uncharacterized protein n=1 Tax=Araneus ventricosus TaxID=182803 RepID=A0A4Y2F3M7_ARAVE|nr:hypothetical protein AVEN_58397-1 [Araneus ventricosus]